MGFSIPSDKPSKSKFLYTVRTGGIIGLDRLIIAGNQPLDLRQDRRVDNGIDRIDRLAACKNFFSKPLFVYAAFGKDIIAKLLPDLLLYLLTAQEPLGEHIGIDYRTAQHRKFSGSRAFAGGNAA